ncbi:MAG: flavodoxin family protein [Chloroflexota bacterium]|nr:flavodoxin family protein [Chloroflexota bacterium]
MRVLVSYFSQTGNTEKVAQAIHEEASRTEESELKKIGEVDLGSLDDYDIVFVGSPTHVGDLSAAVKEFLAKMPKSPRFKVAGFVTHAGYEPEDFHMCVPSFANAAKAKRIVLCGCFDCRGRLAPPIRPVVKENKGVSDEQWERDMQELDAHPNAEDERTAREFARSMLAEA